MQSAASDKKRSIPELTLDVLALYEKALKSAQPGEIIDYSTMSGVIGRNVQGNARHVLNSARRLALRKDGLVFEAVKGVGLKCLTDQEKAHLAPPALKKMRLAAKRTSRKMASIKEFGSLDEKDQMAYNAGRLILGVVSTQTEEKMLEALKPQMANGSLSIVKGLEAMVTQIQIGLKQGNKIS